MKNEIIIIIFLLKQKKTRFYKLKKLLICFYCYVYNLIFILLT